MTTEATETTGGRMLARASGGLDLDSWHLEWIGEAWHAREPCGPDCPQRQTITQALDDPGAGCPHWTTRATGPTIVALLTVLQRQAPAPACAACGRQIEREDTPLPNAAWAPVPWRHHMNEAEARCLPGYRPGAAQLAHPAWPADTPCASHGQARRSSQRGGRSRS